MLIESMEEIRQEDFNEAQTIIGKGIAYYWIENFKEELEQEKDDKEYNKLTLAEKAYSFLNNLWNEVPKSDGCAYENEWCYQEAANWFCKHLTIKEIQLD